MRSVRAVTVRTGRSAKRLEGGLVSGSRIACPNSSGILAQVPASPNSPVFSRKCRCGPQSVLATVALPAAPCCPAALALPLLSLLFYCPMLSPAVPCRPCCPCSPCCRCCPCSPCTLLAITGALSQRSRHRLVLYFCRLKMPHLSIVIPAYNEERRIGRDARRYSRLPRPAGLLQRDPGC
jgi:hypothetical protein